MSVAAWLRAAGLCFASLAGAASAQPLGPAPGPVQIIGRDTAGCIAGAVRLPDTAPGLQTIRVGRGQFWGHPELIATLKLYGERMIGAGLPDLYVGDLSGPRGGPLRGGHVSHQLGLDADVWLDVTPPHPVLPVPAREDMLPPGLVRPDGRGVDPARWRPGHVTLLRIAAGLPGVDRVLVNPAIKKKLCEEAGADRGWLRLIRPWYGHAAHMHIRLRCPTGQPDCVQAAPPPPGDGCDATLQWWFDQLDAPPGPPAVRPALPVACAAVMAAPAG